MDKVKVPVEKKLKSNVGHIFAFLIIQLFSISMDKAKVPVEKKIYSNVDQIFAFLISFLIIQLFSMDKAKKYLLKKKLKSNVGHIFAFLIIRLFSMDKAKVPVEKKIKIKSWSHFRFFDFIFDYSIIQYG